MPIIRKIVSAVQQFVDKLNSMQSVCTPITASPALPRKREPDSAD